jgi:hypothetical protein
VLVIFGEQDVLTPTAPNVKRYTEAGLSPEADAAPALPDCEKPVESCCDNNCR